MKMTWNINLFTFSVICIFSECDGFTVLSIISIKFCGIKFIRYLVFANMVIWHENYIRQNGYLNEVWLLIGRFKVGSLPRMINKELLAQFIYKAT